MLNDLKRQVCKANKELAEQGVVRFTWGNVSGFDPSMGLYVIKPSGVPYEELQPELMVVMSMEGTKVEGRLEPSVDSDIHRAIYMAWPFTVSAIAHTHSTYAVAYAQAGLPIPAIGTTHADYFGDEVPVTRPMTPEEIEGEYETNTGNLIVATAKDAERVPAVLVERHGPFVWGKTPMDAVKTAVILEEVAKNSYLTAALNPNALTPLDPALMERHFARRNGPKAYYGQKNG
ncbi:MAG: L-ribulose-5-phosphate 4-epimerase AraD [Oscillospiraceae bacterium]|jgi:L-ribulose-5-phosphate 4-epimerase|nr:L-ribulose-5-phosphate 4-epimerase AraD [Oscillospiraceae bacterium]